MCNINFRIFSHKLEDEVLTPSIVYICHNQLFCSLSCCSPFPAVTSLQLEKGGRGFVWVSL
jgi:hypothetical protein